MGEKLHFGYNKDYNIGYTGDYLEYMISTKKNVLVLDGVGGEARRGKYGIGAPKIVNKNIISDDFMDYSRHFMDYGAMSKLVSLKKICGFCESSDRVNEYFMELSDSLDISKFDSSQYFSREVWEIKVWEDIYKKYQAHPDEIRSYWRRITFISDQTMSEECFDKLLEECGDISYVIVTDAFTYEHLPSSGCPVDIETSEGIVEAWKIRPGVIMFYMPLKGRMSEEETYLWSKVFEEVFYKSDKHETVSDK